MFDKSLAAYIDPRSKAEHDRAAEALRELHRQRDQATKRAAELTASLPALQRAAKAEFYGADGESRQQEAGAACARVRAEIRTAEADQVRLDREITAAMTACANARQVAIGAAIERAGDFDRKARRQAGYIRALVKAAPDPALGQAGRFQTEADDIVSMSLQADPAEDEALLAAARAAFPPFTSA